MNRETIAQRLQEGQGVLGVELGSTRIKAVLIGEDHAPLASGDYTWENRLENGVWTYSLEDAWTGLQQAYAALKKDVLARYGVKLTKLAGFGVSGMMHGYLPFDAEGKQLAPFRTWRNTMTGAAAQELTELINFQIPQRWSIAHLYQAILNGEAHLSRLAQLTTLAGYIHHQLTGRNVVGVCEASGMFPIDSVTGDYDERMLALVQEKIAAHGYAWRLRDVLPQVLPAGADAGTITPQGALLLDPSGELLPGAAACPPEGDAATGRVATNSVAVCTGNVSAGTSAFAMVVLEKPLSRVYPEIDMVTTPSGKPVAMVHCNNCTSDINAWAGVLKGFAQAAKLDVSMNDIFTAVFNAALEGEPDCGGVVNLPMLSGEPIVDLEEGRPMVVRTPQARMTFANFSRSLVCGAMAGLKIGMRILDAEHVRIDSLTGHGGYFKTPVVGQRLLAAALNTPIAVMETAGEGGPWGMALLAAFCVRKQAGQTLEEYLQNCVFADAASTLQAPQPEDVAGFQAYTERFQQALTAEKAAVELQA